MHVRALEVAQEPRRHDAQRPGARVDEVRREQVAAGLERKRRAEPLALHDHEDDEAKHEQQRGIAKQHVHRAVDREIAVQAADVGGDHHDDERGEDEREKAQPEHLRPGRRRLGKEWGRAASPDRDGDESLAGALRQRIEFDRADVRHVSPWRVVPPHCPSFLRQSATISPFADWRPPCCCALHSS
jgi:hypothetical protein